jgi:TetR/AcrR family transcriptional regulator, transcriptional repressor for nem operon
VGDGKVNAFKKNRILGRHSLAVHLLSAMQGVSVLAHSFHDSGLVATETKHLKSWIQSL